MRQIYAWVLLLFVVVSIDGASNDDKPAAIDKDIRLPESVVPLHYDISILPDLKTSHMEGSVRMDFKVLSATDRVVMHGVNLTVPDDSIEIEPMDSTSTNEPIQVVSVDYDHSKEFIIIQLAPKMRVGRYRIRLDYTGALSNNLKGLYRSDYFDQASQSKK